MSTSLREYLGIRFVGVASDGVRLCVDLDERHLNQAGGLHGGVVTTMFDIACAIALRAHVDGSPIGPHEPTADPLRPLITLTLNTSFLHSAGQGRLTVVARHRGGGKRILFAHAEMHDEAGRLLATAEGNFALHTRANVAG